MGLILHQPHSSLFRRKPCEPGHSILQEPIMIIELYAHTDKETAWDVAQKAGLTGDALGNARHLGSEVKPKNSKLFLTRSGKAGNHDLVHCTMGTNQAD